MRSLGREEWPSVERINQRQGFLVSAILHLTILMILVSHPPTPRMGQEKIDPSTIERKELVFLPPPDVLGPLAPRAKPPHPPVSAPPSAPPGPQAADAGGAKAVPGNPGLRLPPGLGRDVPSGQEGSPARPGPLGQSIPGAVQRLQERLQQDADLGSLLGTGQKTSCVQFDPQIAD